MPTTYEAGEKFSRVFQILVRLMETHQGLTTRQLADEFEITERTVQRYIKTLRDSAGIDIVDHDGRYRIGDHTRLPALQLDRYQAAELLIALRLLHQLRSEQDPALVGALAQLSRALQVPQVSRYLRSTLAHAERRPANQARVQREHVLVDAWVQSREVEVQYVDGEGRETRRVLQPYFLDANDVTRHLYVFAHDSVSNHVRAFRLDRIEDARMLPTTFIVPDSFDIDSLLSGSWAVWQQSGAPDSVVLRFAPEAAQWAREERWPPGTTLEDGGGDGLVVRLRVASEKEMRPWVLRWGHLVEVLEPESLRNHVADALTRAAAQYAAPDGRSGARASRRRH